MDIYVKDDCVGSTCKHTECFSRGGRPFTGEQLNNKISAHAEGEHSRKNKGRGINGLVRVLLGGSSLPLREVAERGKLLCGEKTAVSSRNGRKNHKALCSVDTRVCRVLRRQSSNAVKQLLES